MIADDDGGVVQKSLFDELLFELNKSIVYSICVCTVDYLRVYRLFQLLFK